MLTRITGFVDKWIGVLRIERLVMVFIVRRIGVGILLRELRRTGPPSLRYGGPRKEPEENRGTRRPRGRSGRARFRVFRVFGRLVFPRLQSSAEHRIDEAGTQGFKAPRDEKGLVR